LWDSANMWIDHNQEPGRKYPFLSDCCKKPTVWQGNVLVCGECECPCFEDETCMACGLDAKEFYIELWREVSGTVVTRRLCDECF